jgi:predicted transcriptional regulator
MAHSLADALQRVGASRVEAELIALFGIHADVSTKEAVAATKLRQPEVSVGMRDLVERGWVACEPIAREGKGRPMNRYRLDVEPARMHVHYEALGQQARSNLEVAMTTVNRAWSKD